MRRRRHDEIKAQGARRSSEPGLRRSRERLASPSLRSTVSWGSTLESWVPGPAKTRSGEVRPKVSHSTNETLTAGSPMQRSGGAKERAGRQRCRVRFVCNLLAMASKTHQQMAAALLRTIFAQPGFEIVDAAWAQARDQLNASSPKAGPLMDAAKTEVLAFRRPTLIILSAHSAGRTPHPSQAATLRWRRRADCRQRAGTCRTGTYSGSRLPPPDRQGERVRETR